MNSNYLKPKNSIYFQNDPFIVEGIQLVHHCLLPIHTSVQQQQLDPSVTTLIAGKPHGEHTKKKVTTSVADGPHEEGLLNLKQATGGGLMEGPNMLE